jgi:hypothetical protein
LSVAYLAGGEERADPTNGCKQNTEVSHALFLIIFCSVSHRFRCQVVGYDQFALRFAQPELTADAAKEALARVGVIEVQLFDVVECRCKQAHSGRKASEQEERATALPDGAKGSFGALATVSGSSKGFLAAKGKKCPGWKRDKVPKIVKKIKYCSGEKKL